jgi:hypothetical protein
MPSRRQPVLSSFSSRVQKIALAGKPPATRSHGQLACRPNSRKLILAESRFYGSMEIGDFRPISVGLRPSGTERREARLFIFARGKDSCRERKKDPRQSR